MVDCVAELATLARVGSEAVEEEAVHHHGTARLPAFAASVEAARAEVVVCLTSVEGDGESILSATMEGLERLVAIDEDS